MKTTVPGGGEAGSSLRPEISGFLLLDKSPGQTSFEALWAVKKALGTGKVGHTGTLDKFASGLLIVLAGRATRLSPWISHCDKTYLAAIFFGTETDTLDPEGSAAARGPVPSRQQFEEVLPRFRGNILQTPPLYSAIHLDGRRASELARAGEKPEMKARPVTIYELRLVSWEPPLARILVRCSGGAYIRSLARDLALACGSRAHLAELRRLAVAGFSVEAALCPEAAGGEGVSRAYREALRPVDRTLFEALGIPRLEAGADVLLPMIHGRPLDSLLAGLIPEGALCGEGAPAAVFAGDRFAGIVERAADGRWNYGYVYAGDCGTGGTRAGL
ncbi:MAG: tRNA pseudouridine(55) synthase TruB [Treponema sp.]|jgi:tRNA pseudouridine55 synthase|nr:tRNA pseudouridine(55) synthase TruB [Treponema sp.]